MVGSRRDFLRSVGSLLALATLPSCKPRAVQASRFGVIPDGVTNNWAPLMEALEAAKNSTPRALHIPAGFYFTDPPLAIQDFEGPLTVYGDGMDATILKARTKDGFRLENVSGLTFRDIGLEGHGFLAKRGFLNATGPSGTRDLEFLRVCVKSPAYYGFGFQRGSHKNHVYRYCQVRNSPSDGWDYKNEENGNENLLIEYSQSYSPGMSAADAAGFDLRVPGAIVRTCQTYLTNPVTTAFRARRGEDGDPSGLGAHEMSFIGCTAAAMPFEDRQIGFMVRAGGVVLESCDTLGCATGLYVDPYREMGPTVRDFTAAHASYGVRVSTKGHGNRLIRARAHFCETAFQVFRDVHDVYMEDCSSYHCTVPTHFLPGADVTNLGFTVL